MDAKLPSGLLACQCDVEHVQIVLTLLVWQEHNTSLASSDHSFESSIHPLFLCDENVDCCIHTLLACLVGKETYDKINNIIKKSC